MNQCLRTVLHVFPGFVVVLDEIGLDKPESISLRWNTAATPTRIGENDFSLQFEPVGLSARVLNLSGTGHTNRIGCQHYRAPWNQDQFGGILPDRDCPYFESYIESRSHCRLLTLFAVQAGSTTKTWTEQDGRHVGVIGDQQLDVVISSGGVTVRSASHDRDWEL